jgi:hypothetical protein
MSSWGDAIEAAIAACISEIDDPRNGHPGLASYREGLRAAVSAIRAIPESEPSPRAGGAFQTGWLGEQFENTEKEIASWPSALRAETPVSRYKEAARGQPDPRAVKAEALREAAREMLVAHANTTAMRIGFWHAAANWLDDRAADLERASGGE